MFRDTLLVTYRVARRIVITVIGATVILFGLILVFLPGPALLVIPAGLAILALEYAWARRWLAKVRNGAEYTLDWWNKRKRNRSE